MRKMFQRTLLFSLFLLYTIVIQAQELSTVYGVVRDERGAPLSEVNIVLFENQTIGTSSNDKGYYLLEVPSGDTTVIVFSFAGETVYKKLFLDAGKTYRLNVEIIQEIELSEFVVTESKRNELIMNIPIEDVEYIPDPTGDPIIAILKKYVTSNNELSAQYSVRGGNFDENLVYVNDFEIYRPLLVRSGQQEGLAFPNYDLVSNISFSAGGFEARYGDKLSSVLDIQYKKPTEFEAGATASFLGGSFHVNNGSDSGMYYLLGARYKTNQYLLNSLNTQGEYQPVFYDVQGLLGYRLSDKSDLEILGNFSSSSYTFIPQSRVTSTGVVNNVLRLEVFFDGQEVNRFMTGFGGVSYQYRPSNSTGLKILASAYRSLEDETFDVIGDYWLGVVESNPGDDDFNEVAFALGVGTFQNFARNYLDVTVANIGHEGYSERGAHYLRWGGRAQFESIQDDLKEWERVDSAGYSIPYTGDEVTISQVYRSDILLESMRYNAYIQDTWTPNLNDVFFLTYGVRSSYWTVNNEITLTPRVQMAWKPNWVRKDSSLVDIVWKGAIGLYNQPPFYRELRDFSGNINTTVRAQKSVHVLVAADYNFKAWNRDFKFISEVYYKYLYEIVPYDVENVRVRYYGENLATGYAAGIDFRLHGEIVEDADSWVSLSFLRTRENVQGDSTFNDELELVERGNIPRPTDQLVNFGMFFQDYIPGNKNLKVHLNFLFGSGLPFGPPQNQFYRNSFRVPPYRRVDIGFSALLLDKERNKGDKMWSNIESLWAGIEIFNLLGVQNTISYLWVKDINNTQYAFPNYLTDRRINLRFIMKI